MREITITTAGQFVRKSGKNAGVQGEANVTTLHLIFDESWAGYGKRIVWRDASGENPVAVVLFNGEGEDALSYDTTIPAEPLKLPGWCSFTLEGYQDGAVALTAEDHLEVSANDADYAPAEPTPSQTQQILSALASAETTVQQSATAAESWAVGGTGSRAWEDTDNAGYYSARAAESAQGAAEDAAAAGQSAREAAQSAASILGSVETAAESAQSAQAYASQAQAAQTGAENAQAQAREAREGAQTAQAQAQTAQTQAQGAQEGAEDARDKAQSAQAQAEGARDAAQAAQALAQAAQSAIEGMAVEGETLSAGSRVSVEKTVGEDGSVTLTFSIPEGETGPRGISIASVARTAGSGAPGTTDTYTITMTNGETSAFTVYNGANGEGAGDFMSDGSVPMTGPLILAGAPTQDSHAANKAYADGIRTALDSHAADGTRHITAAERTAWNGKQDAIPEGYYQPALTGEKGTFVGFDADGNPEAQPVHIVFQMGADGNWNYTLDQLLELYKNGAIISLLCDYGYLPIISTSTKSNGTHTVQFAMSLHGQSGNIGVCNSVAITFTGADGEQPVVAEDGAQLIGLPYTGNDSGVLCASKDDFPDDGGLGWRPWDTEPTQGSVNPVTSGGVKAAIEQAASIIREYPAATDITAGDVCDVVDGEASYTLTGAAPTDYSGTISYCGGRITTLVFDNKHSVICYYYSNSMRFATVNNSDGSIVATSTPLTNNSYYSPMKIEKINEDVIAVLYSKSSLRYDYVGFFKFDSTTGAVTHIKSVALAPSSDYVTMAGFCKLSDEKVLILQIFPYKAIYAAVATISAYDSSVTIGSTFTKAENVSGDIACGSIALDVIENTGDQYTIIGAFCKSGTSNSTFEIRTIKVSGDTVINISDSLLGVGNIRLSGSLSDPVSIFADKNNQKVYFPANVNEVLTVFRLDYADDGSVSNDTTYTYSGTLTANVQSRRFGNYIYAAYTEMSNSKPKILSLAISEDGALRELSDLTCWSTAISVANPFHFSVNDRVGIITDYNKNYIMLGTKDGVLGYDVHFSSTQAIALNSAAAGEAVRLAFDGIATAPLADGAEIVSDGVMGKMIGDKLSVLPEWIRDIGVKIETGSYTGTGTYGSGNMNTLTFGFEPKLVLIDTKAGATQAYRTWMTQGCTGASISGYMAYKINSVSWAGNSVSWYSEKAIYQLNNSGTEYIYVAIG